MNKNLRSLIAENKIDEVINHLRKSYNIDSDIQNEVLHIAGRYEEYKRQKRLNLADDTTLNIELSKIREALLYIIQRVDKNSLLTNVEQNEFIHTNKTIVIIVFIGIIISCISIWIFFRKKENLPVLTKPKTEEITNDKKTIENPKDSVHKNSQIITLEKFVSNGFYGYKSGGSTVIEPIFDDAGIFSENKAVVKKNGKSFVINERGQKLFDLAYVSFTNYLQNRLTIFDSNKAGYLDGNGKLIIPPKFDGAWQFHEGRAKIEIKGKRGFIDTLGNIVVPPIYDDADFFMAGRSPVVKLDKWSIIDYNGLLITQTTYDFAAHYAAGYCVVYKNNKFMYLDLNGREFSNIHYPDGFDEASSFSSEGIANVKIKNKEFCININFNTIECKPFTSFMRYDKNFVNHVMSK